MPKFFLTSPQTRPTKLVRAFASEVIPERLADSEDLHKLLKKIRGRVKPADRQKLLATDFSNPQVAQRLNEAKQGIRLEFSGRREVVQDPSLIHLSLAGVRSADEILRDGVVSATHDCTDLTTLLMAVLRQQGIPCRQVRIVDSRLGMQTAVVEAKIGGQIYRVKPADRSEGAVRQGVAEKVTNTTVLVASKDNLASGIDVAKLSILLANLGRPATDAIIELSKKVRV